MFFLVWLGGPVALGTVLSAALARGWVRVYALFGLGLLLGFGVVVSFYLSAPPAPSQDCSHCEHFLGRWWEPTFVFFLVAVGYVAWMVGVALGLLLRLFIRSANEKISAETP